MSDNIDMLTGLKIEPNDELLHLVAMVKSGQVDIDSLGGDSFVFLVGFVMSRFGWEIQHVRGPNDPGFDLIGRFKNPLGFDTTSIVQCKHQKKKRPVDLNSIQMLYGAKIELGIQNAIFVTNSSFTQGSSEFASSKQDLQLVDGGSFSNWLSNFSFDSVETNRLEINTVANPDLARQLVSIVQKTCNRTVSAAESERVISRLFPILANSELISSTQLEDYDSTPRAAAIAAVFLSAELPKNDSSKIAIWHVCSKLLMDRFALLPSELEEFYGIACSDTVSDPSNTLEWIWVYLQTRMNLNRMPK